MGLRKRIIGAIILMALAVIFLPMLLNQRPLDNFNVSQLSERPPSPNVTFASAESIQTLANKNSQSMENHAEAAQAFIVQVNTFSDLHKAEKLIKQLRAAKYPAFLQTIQNQSQVQYQVLVGPQIEQDKAKQILENIQRQFKITGKLLNYQPTDPTLGASP